MMRNTVILKMAKIDSKTRIFIQKTNERTYEQRTNEEELTGVRRCSSVRGYSWSRSTWSCLHCRPAACSHASGYRPDIRAPTD